MFKFLIYLRFFKNIFFLNNALKESKNIYLIIIIFIIAISFKLSVFKILILDLIKKKLKRDKNNKFLFI